MEVFEEKRRVERQASTASSHRGRNSKIRYILTMAGIVLFTSALLIIIHFSREYSFWSSENSYLQEKAKVIPKQERLERRACDVPFCNTKECVFVASTMLDSMNTDADPCTDFYSYACGGYSKSKAVPYGMDYLSLAKEAQEELLIDIRKMLEKLSPETDDSAVGKMKKIYDSCMNSTLRNEVENRTLSSFLSDLKLVPPNFAVGDPIDFEQIPPWTEIVADLEQYQIHTLFKPHFIHKENAAPDTFEVDCLVPFLNPEAYRNSTDDELAFQLVMYKESMRSALALLHMSRASRKEFVEDVMKIELDIIRAISSEEPFSPFLTGAHQQQLRNIWKPVVGDAAQHMDVISTCNYDMEKILTMLNAAPNKSVVRYVTWRLLMQIMQHLGEEFRSLNLHYMTKLPRFDYAYESQWKGCVDLVRKELGFVATKSLLDNGYIKEETVNAVNAQFLFMKRDIAVIFSPLLEGVDKSFAEKFLHKLKGISSLLDGVDPSFDEKFLNKLETMTLYTGYVDSLKDDKVLNSVYNELNLGDDYFSNVLELKRFNARKKFSSLWNPLDGDAFNKISLEDSPLSISTNYDYISNTVRIGLGLLRSPAFVYSEEIPEFLSFGFSSIIAHEMGRAFDATGSCYDGEGRHFEKVFWPSAIEQKYDDFLMCIRNQVAMSNDNNHLNVNDTQVLNNIIADMGSFFIPYEGLRGHLTSNLDEKPLPGVPLNKKQTFYVQTAQMFCEIRNKPSSDPQSKYLLSPKLRINTAVSNMEDFRNVFNCPARSAMNLENRCNLFSLLPEENQL